MAKFTFIAEEDGSIVTKQFEEVSIHTVLEEFKYFLKGAGYEFDGHLELVPEDGEINWDSYKGYEYEPTLGSNYSFDTDVNLGDNISIKLE